MTCVTRGLAVCLIVLTVACGETRTSDEHVAAAETFLAQDEYRSAVLELKNALRQEPWNARARQLLGEAYFSMGDLASAEKELQQAVERGGPVDEIYPLFARSLVGLGHYEVLDSLDVERLDAEGRSTVLAAQAISLGSRGENEAALAAIDAVLDAPPVSVFALVTGAQFSLLRDASGTEANYLIDQAIEADRGYAPAWRLRADIATRSGDLERAEQAYTEAIALSPQPFADYYKRGLVRLSAKNLDGADDDLNAMKNLAPTHPGVNYLAGMLALSREDTDLAMESFMEAATVAEQYPQSLYYLAALNREAGNLVLALGYADRFLAMATKDVRARKLTATIEYQLANHSRVQKLLQPVVDSYGDDVYALNLLANSLLASGQVDQGMALLERVAELEPESTDALARLGAGLLATGEQQRGMENLREAQRRNPDDAKTQNALVRGYLQQGELDAALSQVRTYAERQPFAADPFNLEGRIYLATGDMTQAMNSFETAQEKDPKDPQASLALAELALQNRDLKAARTYLDEALTRDPEQLQALLGLASLEALEGNEQPMVSTLKRTVKAHPSALQPRLILARYYLSQNNIDAAIEALGDLTDASRGTPPVMAVLAQIELARQRYNEANSLLKQLVSAQPANPEALYMLAQSQLQLNKVEEARVSLERTVSLRPDYLPARISLARLYALLGNDDGLETEVTYLVDSAPDSPDVIKLQIEVAQQRGDDDEVLTLLERLYVEAPDSRVALMLAAQRRVGGDEAGALNLLRGWLVENPNDVSVLNTYGWFLSDAGYEEEAIQIYLKVIEQDPTNVSVLNNLAWRLRESDPTQALEYIERAITRAQNPRSIQLLDTKAMVLLNKGDLRPARRAIDTAMAESPDNPDLRLTSARISVAEGDMQTAATALNALLKSESVDKAEVQALLDKLEK